VRSALSFVFGTVSDTRERAVDAAEELAAAVVERAEVAA
jgi:hypothetical protein